jgi:hypothetical protein
MNITTTKILPSTFDTKSIEMSSVDNCQSMFKNKTNLLKINFNFSTVEESEIFKNSKVVWDDKSSNYIFEIHKNNLLYLAKFSKTRIQDYTTHTTLTADKISIINYFNPINISNRIKLNNGEIDSLKENTLLKINNKYFKQIIKYILQNIDMNLTLNSDKTNIYLKEIDGQKYWNIIIPELKKDYLIEYDGTIPILMQSEFIDSINKKFLILKLKKDKYSLTTLSIEKNNNENEFIEIEEDFDYPQKDEILVFNKENLESSIIGAKSLTKQRNYRKGYFLNFLKIGVEETYKNFKNTIKISEEEFKKQVNQYVYMYNETHYLKNNRAQNFLSYDDSIFNLLCEVDKGKFEITDNESKKQKYLINIENTNKDNIYKINNYNIKQLETDIYSLELENNIDILYIPEKKLDNYKFRNNPVFYKNYFQMVHTGFGNIPNTKLIHRFDNPINNISDKLGNEKQLFLIETINEETKKYDLHSLFMIQNNYVNEEKKVLTFINKEEENYTESCFDFDINEFSILSKFEYLFKQSDKIEYFQTNNKLLSIDNRNPIYNKDKKIMKEEVFLKENINDNEISIKCYFNMEKLLKKFKFDFKNDNVYSLNNNQNLIIVNFIFDKELLLKSELNNKIKNIFQKVYHNSFYDNICKKIYIEHKENNFKHEIKDIQKFLSMIEVLGDIDKTYHTPQSNYNIENSFKNQINKLYLNISKENELEIEIDKQISKNSLTYFQNEYIKINSNNFSNKELKLFFEDEVKIKEKDEIIFFYNKKYLLYTNKINFDPFINSLTLNNVLDYRILKIDLKLNEKNEKSILNKGELIFGVKNEIYILKQDRIEKFYNKPIIKEQFNDENISFNF